MSAPTALQLVSSTKQCRKCNAELVPLINWTKGQIKCQSNICRDCHNVITTKWRRDNNILAREIIKKCPSTRNENRRIYQRTWRSKNKDRNAYNTYQQNAKTRSLAFNITFNEFKYFWKLPCSYCGDPIDTIGLDRIDSSKGYSMSNLTSCCKVCNWMKNAIDKDDFVNHCRKIVSYMGGI